MDLFLIALKKRIIRLASLILLLISSQSFSQNLVYNSICDCSDAQSKLKAKIIDQIEQQEQNDSFPAELSILMKELKLVVAACSTKFAETTDPTECKNWKQNEAIEAEYALILRVLNMRSEGIYCH